MTTRRRLWHVTATIAAIALVPGPAAGQDPGATQPNPRQRALELDRNGQTAEARVILRALVDSAPDPEARASAWRVLALSYAFDGDCDNTAKYEEMVIAYWMTREEEDPQNAFYEQGERANEAARVCIDAGHLDAAERLYRRGYELGVKEPEPKTHPVSLWDYRLTHALGRIAARRGNKVEAQRQIGNARRILDSDPTMAEGQERYFPYLVGYVALFTNDLATAEVQFTKLLAIPGNQRDPFMHSLLAMTYEHMGRTDEAMALYQKAFDLARAHNPPAAFVRRFVREKLEIPE